MRGNSPELHVCPGGGASPTPLHHPSLCTSCYCGPVGGVLLREVHSELSAVLQNMVHRKKAKVIASSRPAFVVGLCWLLVEGSLSLLSYGYCGQGDAKGAFYREWPLERWEEKSFLW